VRDNSGAQQGGGNPKNLARDARSCRDGISPPALGSIRDLPFRISNFEFSSMVMWMAAG
jgi:hypothetical protein